MGNKKSLKEIIDKYIPFAILIASALLVLNFFLSFIVLGGVGNFFGEHKETLEFSYLGLATGLDTKDLFGFHPAQIIIFIMLCLPLLIMGLQILKIKKSNKVKDIEDNKFCKIVLGLSIVYLALHIAAFAVLLPYGEKAVNGASSYYMGIPIENLSGPTFFGVMDYILAIFLIVIGIYFLWGDRLGINAKLNSIKVGGKNDKENIADEKKQYPPQVKPPVYSSNAVTKLPVLIAVDTLQTWGQMLLVQ